MGKIQVSIRKQAKGKWSSLGLPLELHNTFLRKKDRGETQRPSDVCTFDISCVTAVSQVTSDAAPAGRLQLHNMTEMH